MKPIPRSAVVLSIVMILCAVLSSVAINAEDLYRSGRQGPVDPTIRPWQQPEKHRCSKPGVAHMQPTLGDGSGGQACSPDETRCAARAATANIEQFFATTVVQSRSLSHARSCAVTHGTSGSSAHTARCPA